MRGGQAEGVAIFSLPWYNAKEFLIWRLRE
jgi:hypothetical protein